MRLSSIFHSLCRRPVPHFLTSHPDTQHPSISSPPRRAFQSVTLTDQKRWPRRVSAEYLQHGDDGAQGLDELVPGQRRHPQSALQQVHQDGLGCSAHLPNNTDSSPVRWPPSHLTYLGHSMRSLESCYSQHLFLQTSYVHSIILHSVLNQVFPLLMISLFIFNVHFPTE